MNSSLDTRGPTGILLDSIFFDWMEGYIQCDRRVESSLYISREIKTKKTICEYEYEFQS
jgi:hypothetical protein